MRERVTRGIGLPYSLKTGGVKWTPRRIAWTVFLVVIAYRLAPLLLVFLMSP